MLVTEVRHIGITVDDLEEAEEYCALLGFIRFSKGKCDGKFAKKLTGKEVMIEWVKMQNMVDRSMIELIKYTPDIGIKTHIALTVKNIFQFGVKSPAIDSAGRKIKYVNVGDLTLEVVQ